MICPAIYHYIVENSKDLNSLKEIRHYILIPSGFYKTRMSVEVDFFMSTAWWTYLCVK